MSKALDALYAQAEEGSKKIEQRTQPKAHQRDERLMDVKGTRTIYFRMFPDMVSDQKKLDLPYAVNIIKSVVTGKNIYCGTNPTFKEGGEDFWQKKQYELWDQDQKDKAKLLYPTPRKLVNVFIIKDTGDESNNKTFKVYGYNNKPTDPDRPKAGSPIVKGIERFLKQLEEEADGDLVFSQRHFYSLGTDGVTFRMEIVEAKSKNEFSDVDVTILKAGEKINGFQGFPEDKLVEIYKSKGTALEELVDDPKSEEDLERIYKRHVLGVSTSSSTTNYFDDSVNTESTPTAPTDDTSSTSTPETITNEGEDDTDDDIRKLLAEM